MGSVYEQAGADPARCARLVWFMMAVRLKRRSSSTKRRLADAVEAASQSQDDPDSKRAGLVEVLYQHAEMLASERAVGLPAMVHDDLVSGVGERVAVALARLDLDAPPAQQVAYLDGQIHHALADACRAVDPLGRGSRTLRKSFELSWEEAAQRLGAEPGGSVRETILDQLVDGCSSVLRSVVGYGISPERSAAVHAGDAVVDADISGQVVVNLGRTQLLEAVAAHPDPDVREYLVKVAAGERARRPPNFHRRLGPTVPQILAAYARERMAEIE